MSQVTQSYKRNFSGSVGAGIGSLIGGRQYFILEHRISSRYHRAGETQEIIVDQIEIGRDTSCQVRFDERFTTVSRRHAAIVREGDRWKLVQLSQTNPTLLNGNSVGQEWYLQSGDEIQLSVGGPKLGFIIPSGNRTGSIGLTRRIGLFGQQALRPYRRAIVLLSIALLLAIAGMTSWKLHSDFVAGGKIDSLTLKADSLENLSKAQYDSFQSEQDSIAQVLEKTKRDLNDEKESNKRMKDDLERRISDLSSQNPLHKQRPTLPVTVGTTVTDNAAIEACLPYIYYIYVEQIEFSYPGKEKTISDAYLWSATGVTGFLLDDGRLVTARHVIEPWYYVRDYSDSLKILLNWLSCNGGKVSIKFVAVSSSGDRISFTNQDVICHRSTDKFITDEHGYELRLARFGDGDWAYLKTNRNKGLKIDRQAAVSLARGVELTTLGFPLGLGANAPDDIKPVWGHAATASEGLNNGVILVPRIEGIGQITFYLCGLAVENGGQWQLVRVGDGNEKNTPKAEREKEKDSGLTPIK